MDSHHPGVGSTVGATVDVIPGLDAVSNHLATAVGALRCEGMNGAFKAVIVMRLAFCGDLHHFIVIISANFAFHTPTTHRQAQSGALQANRCFPEKFGYG